MAGHGAAAVNIVLFCGGRGSASLIRELIRLPQIRLTLLVNAYDDGLSTGALREFMPGLLGPSDFRKNLAGLTELYSAAQYALRDILEYRLPANDSDAELASLRRFAVADGAGALIPPLDVMFGRLDHPSRERVRALIAKFFTYHDSTGRPFHFEGCSLGNIVFAGAYLEEGRNFNRAIAALARLVCSQATVVNVSNGECRVLVALKADGEVLWTEERIVGPQSASPIEALFFLDETVSAEERGMVEQFSSADKRAWLHRRQTLVQLSPEAKDALEHAHVVIYGPGTQHSSLLPSYRIAQTARAITESPAAVKALVINLHTDHDIQGCTATDLIDRALEYLDDPDNDTRVITHVLYNRPADGLPRAIALDRSALDAAGTYRGAQVLEGRFANPSTPGAHSGFDVVRTLLDVYDGARAGGAIETLDVYVDLYGRSPAADALLHEFRGLNWTEHVPSVRLRVNRLSSQPADLPAHVSVEATEFDEVFSDVHVFLDWLSHGKSAYLATLTGDGEYRLGDILLGLSFLRVGGFGALYGSRNQSRRQFTLSLHAAYGERPLLYAVSWLGAFVLTALFSLRFGMIFSDPLTGFRIYRRSKLNEAFCRSAEASHPRSASTITRLLIDHGVEIAEIPVFYRTFTGFTRPWWRLRRGLSNLRGIFKHL